MLVYVSLLKERLRPLKNMDCRDLGLTDCIVHSTVLEFLDSPNNAHTCHQSFVLERSGRINALDRVEKKSCPIYRSYEGF
jgi:hypothetical protein